MNANIACSQRRKLPLMVIAIRTAAVTGTEMYGLTWKYRRASETPMNSVTMVRKLRMNKSPTLNQPQNRPNRSLMSRACPTPVTAPSLTTISWLTISTGISSSSVHSRL